MPQLPEKLTFPHNGLFYDMVTAFTAAIAGLESIFDVNNRMNFQPNEGVVLEGRVHPEIRLESFSIHRLMITGVITTQYLTQSLCNMLINTAYESVKDRNDHSPLFEFFRHIRNASSHKNQFFFRPNEPQRPAEWRGLVIDHNAKGASNPLSGTQCFGGFIGIADAIQLIWDVEQYLT
jgi:hypothetical protein